MFDLLSTLYTQIKDSQGQGPFYYSSILLEEQRPTHRRSLTIH